MSKALRLTQNELLNLQDRIAGRPTAKQMRDKPVEKVSTHQKYGNEKVLDDGVTFDSKAEHKRWQYLDLMQRGKKIKDLRLQVPFVLIPPQVSPSGKKVRECVYIADFTYTDEKGRSIIEDVKGAVTPEFRIKRKLLLLVHGIEISEVRC